MKRLTLGALTLAALAAPAFADRIELGPRPAFLIDRMPEGALKTKLASCADMEPVRSDFSIGHRGAALMFPEHTEQSYRAAARMGAGILECDVTFTKDKELVCRHAQNDLHTTTNILATDLAANCTTGFAPATGDKKASAECRTSDITLAEFKSLTGKMDAADKSATTVAGYMNGTPRWRTDLYATEGKIMTHAESIALFKELGVKFTPELKSPSVDMPFDGFSQEDYAQKMINEYKAAGVDPKNVFAQSFNLNDVLYWIKAEPEFGKQAVYLVEWHDGFNEQDAKTWNEDFAALKAQGVNYLSPSINMLLTVKDGQIAASDYAKAAKDAGLHLISWTLERSGPLATGGGWYFQSVKDATTDDSVYFTALDVLAQEVGIVGMFSDWPATTTYYASCMAQGTN
ncbi:glycerophosphoryl diester phosphodiesterase [Thalassovita litoralis]|jgi:glycerophosphoryl diester phosphodiesterase|uniref:glycerophosphodiester phosphodiesterase n=1 Tax=Thalassovita litoralis TaxID=1010611 RepID=A0A521CWQ1_9RHOB|nr:glycerophosphodiester phosphodiesterase family protein [Thalassovita litoralis]SMO63885.1 glycerophosphoryl diester phosphodiesterase [Thalassovita litoralis]